MIVMAREIRKIVSLTSLTVQVVYNIIIITLFQN